MDRYLDAQGKEYEKPDNIEPQWRISGYAIVLSPMGEMLVVEPTWNTLWDLPGGKIEKNESIHEGVVRECYEETGYEVHIAPQPMYVGERYFYVASEQHFYKSVILVYRGELMDGIQHGEIINSVEANEIERVMWKDLRKLSVNTVHPTAWPAIEQFLREKESQK